MGHLVSALALVAGTTLTLPHSARQEAEPVHTARGESFTSWSDFTRSELFRSAGLRCGTPDRDPTKLGTKKAVPSDCGYGVTNPAAEYAPGEVYDIPVVFHVIQRTNGQGYVSPAQVQSQIQILNEDFGALPGSLGAPGVDTGIRFHLATVDPGGNPTTGITYTSNNSWFNDSGTYWKTLAWDTNRYLNIYTNSAGGDLGYVPEIPQAGNLVGFDRDRVVVLWSTVGLNGPIGAPFNKGRTATHEVGHYLGLLHTFDGGCGSASACYTTGDLICDTNRESTPHSGCSSFASSCGSPDPIHNYMDYSDDTCMWEFTQEQARRMRCTLENWRPLLAVPATDCNGNGIADAADLAAGTSLDLDGDGQPDECQPLSADRGLVSVSLGGVVDFALEAGGAAGGDLYLLLGSSSGTAPGLVLDGVTLPLAVPDTYFDFSLANANGGALADTFGVLGAGGDATASLTIPPGSSLGLAGLSLHHAFLTLDAGSGVAESASNAVPLLLVP